jgi:hypothetical protein
MNSFKQSRNLAKFFKLIDLLNETCIKTGLILGSLSEKFYLKINNREYHNNNEDEISFILDIMIAEFGIGIKNKVLFHSMISESISSTRNFKSNEKMNLIHIIEGSVNSKDVIFSSSRLDTISLLNQKDNKWKFFMPIDARETSFLAIKILASLISSQPLKGVQWVIGNTDTPELSVTGLLFIVKNCRVRAVCLDELDLTLLRENFALTSDDRLEIISPDKLNNSFYPKRAKTSEKIIRAIEMYNHESLNITNYTLSSFDDESNVDLLNAFELASYYAHKDDLKFMGLIAKWALTEENVSDNVFSKSEFSLCHEMFEIQIMNQNRKKIFLKNIRHFLEQVVPFSTKIDLAKIILNEPRDLDFEQKLDKIINNIKNNPDCTDDLKLNIDYPTGLDLETKSKNFRLELENYENDSQNEKSYFHTRMLHYALSVNEDGLRNIVKKYIENIEFREKTISWDKNLSLKDLEENLVNKLVLDLSIHSDGIKFYILHDSKFIKIFENNLKNSKSIVK